MTRTRIFALTLVGLAFLSLGYLKVATADDPVSVPKGALAGDLLLDPCTYSTQDGNYAADCGTLVVPENRSDPQSRLIAVPVTRIRAQTDEPAEPIFRLEGGPGKTNMNFSMASRFVAERDVVLVGYRGIDGSVRLDCPEVESALKHSTDLLAEKSLTAYADGLRECAERLTDEASISAASFPQRSTTSKRRVALGYNRIDLVSESAGTCTAMICAWRYPDSVHRSVMIGANPPGHFVWDERHSTTRSGASQALLAGRKLQRPDRGPGRDDSGHRDPGRLVLPADRPGHHAGRLLLLARGDHLRERASVGSDGDRLLARRLGR